MMLRELNVSVKQAGAAAPRRFYEHRGIGLVEPEWFAIMDYTWLQGDPKTALRAPNSVVLTQSWAKRYFGEANPIGRTLTLNNTDRRDRNGPAGRTTHHNRHRSGAVYIPGDAQNAGPCLRHDGLGLAQQHQPGVCHATEPRYCSGQSSGRFLHWRKKHYGVDASVFRFHLQPMREFHFDVARGGTTIRASLLWSLGVVGLLLIVAACINFINLATVQALRRSKEVGIRKTLGSSRWQLIRQFLLETSLIIGVATGFALLLVLVALPLFNNWVQLDLALRLDGLTIAFIGLMLIVVILLAGGYPAAVLSGFSPGLALRGALTITSAGGFTVRRVLVVTQFVVCQVLILGALIVANQIRYIQRTDLGFRKDNVLIVDLPYGQKAKHDAFKQQLSSYADVQSVSLSHRSPASTLQFGGFFKFNGSTEWSKFPIRDRLADADYLNTYSLKLLAGRNIIPGDTIHEYLINETLLHKLGFQNPQQVLGKTVQHYLSSVPLPIVGVIQDFHQKSLREPIEPCIIASRADWYRQAGIRISGNDPAQTVQRIRQTWQQLFPDEVFEYQFMDEQLAKLYETETLTARLINVFTGIAILICCLGLYGLVSHVVVQRTKEIGIRKVLGASVTSIVALLSKDFLKLVFLAIVIASPIAWYAMNRWLQDFAYRIDIEWWVFALAGLLAVGIALLTVSFQSIKAALMNPVKSLRSE